MMMNEEKNKKHYKQHFFEKFAKSLSVKQNILFIVIIILFIPYLYDFSTLAAPKDFFTLCKVANFHYTERVLLQLDNLKLQDTKLSIIIRNNLMNQYMKLNNSFSSDNYNAIGFFYTISNEFEKYSYNRYLQAENIKTKNTIDSYNAYKTIYLQELYKVLMEYSYRDKSKKMYLDIYGYHYLRYVIPNRITIFPYFALAYLKYNTIEIDEKNLKELKYIFSSFETIYNQEQNLNTQQYRARNNKINKQIFDYYYPKFLNAYATEIIFIENKMNKESLCADIQYFKDYSQMTLFNGNKNKEILNIIHQCNYQ